MRGVLIELFEREFVESQEALGMTLVGQFRDLDDPNRFVWLRGFADMTTRAQALARFLWRTGLESHREAANETMIDSDNVLLLRPARPASGFSLENAERQAPGATENPRGLVVATIYHLKDGTGNDLVDFFERRDSIGTDQSWRVRYRVFCHRESSEQLFGVARARSGECLCLVLSFSG